MGTIASPDATTAPDREVLTWEGFGGASRELAQQIVESGWIPDLIVAIARGGLIPAGAIAYAMDVKAIGTMNVEFYSGIGETLTEPVLLPPLMDVSAMDGKRVLVVDDVSDSGKTLKMVMDSSTSTACLWTAPPRSAWRPAAPSSTRSRSPSSSRTTCGRTPTSGLTSPGRLCPSLSRERGAGGHAGFVDHDAHRRGRG